LERRSEAVWEGVEEPRLQGWRSGVDIDLGPDGTRLHRYEAAAHRLFRSAWMKLERLRKERDVPFIPPCERGSAAEPAAPPAPPPGPAPGEAPPGRDAGAPRGRLPESRAPPRAGGDGARLLDRRPEPARDQPRPTLP